MPTRLPDEQAPKEQKPESGDRGAWPRFERAVDAAFSSGPRHRASRKKIASLRPPGSPTYNEPVSVFGVVNEGGKWRPFEPYGLLPDGNIEFAKLVSTG
jgi:hypothetical protein